MTSTKTLLDLNKDILQHMVTRNAGFRELGRLAQTCKSMRDTLYDPIFWRNAFPVIGLINTETAASLQRRQIKRIKIAEQQPTKSLASSLMLLAGIDSLEILLFRDGSAGNSELQDLPAVELKNLNTVIVTITDKYVPPAHLLAGLGKIVPAMTNLEHLIVFQMGPGRCDQPIKTSLDHQCLNLAHLKDFGYIYVHDDDIGCCNGNKTSYNWRPDSEGLPISQCEKLEAIAIDSHTSFLEVQKYNNLQHLGLCLHPGFFPPQTDENKLLMPSVKSLVVTCICARNNSDFRSLCKLVDLFPNLIALDLSYIDMSRQLKDSGHNMECFVSHCPKLKVLYFRAGNAFSDDDLLSIIHTMSDCENIGLTRKTLTTKCKQPQRIIDDIVKCQPKLKSFLFSPSNLNVCNIPSLRYKSQPSDSNKIMVKKEDVHQSNPLSTDHASAKRRKISPKWVPCNSTEYSAAFGSQDFYSESNYCNSDLLSHERRALVAIAREYERRNSRQSHSDSDEEYRWDSDYEEWVRITDDDDDWWDEDVYYGEDYW